MTVEKPSELTAAAFIARLQKLKSATELKKYQRYFKFGEGQYAHGDKFIGVRMGSVFNLAKEFIDMPPAEISKLLKSDIHEARAGATSIMDKQARSKKITPERRTDLYEVYMKNLKGINNWDLVDLGAPFVVGSYLFGKKRDVLYKMAKSKNMWERRTAIISTLYFIRQRDVADTFKIAALLVGDREDLIHKAVGGALRFAGDVDKRRLSAFLEKHAAGMPRTMLRYAIEHFRKAQREYYMGLGKA
jgi:3-methyladenine DNA glycosylase AlkD